MYSLKNPKPLSYHRRKIKACCPIHFGGGMQVIWTLLQLHHYKTLLAGLTNQAYTIGCILFRLVPTLSTNNAKLGACHYCWGE